MVLAAAEPIRFVREETGEVLDARLAAALHEALAAELVELMGRQPLARKAALKVSQKRVAALSAGLLERAAESLESEWDQAKLDMDD